MVTSTATVARDACTVETEMTIINYYYNNKNKIISKRQLT